MKYIKYFVYILSIVYLSIILFFFLIQDKLLFNSPGFINYEDDNSIQIENFTASDNKKLDMFFLNDNFEKILIYFGGNSEEIRVTKELFGKNFNKSNILFVNYRGYGKSEGLPSEEKLKSDSLEIFDHLRKKYPEAKIGAIGRSLGSGVAFYLASERELFKLALVTPYDSITNVAQSKYPYIPVNIILTNKFDNLKLVSKVEEETLILVAAEDKVIPAVSTLNLFNFLSDNNKVGLTKINDSTHNDILFKADFYKEIDFFFNGF